MQAWSSTWSAAPDTMAASSRAEPMREVEVDPAIFFEDVFTERAARLREQAEQLREELELTEDAQPLETRTEDDHG